MNRNKPNVLLLLIDDQGYGDFSCHGNPILKTPYLDQLYNDSIRLTDFHVAPICTPTRSQLMTGVDAARNGAYCWSYGREFIRQDVKTIAEIFSENDYCTGHFGKWHLGDNYPYRPQDRGFQETIYFGGASIAQTPDYWNNDCFDDHFLHNGIIQQHPGYYTDVFFDKAMKYISSCSNDNTPFFVYLPTGVAHWPLWVPDQYREPYRELPPGLASFYAMLAHLDETVKRLDFFLEENNLRENTILIFMTDNGSGSPDVHCYGKQVHNAGMKGRKGSLYEGGHRVPCFIRWPAGGLEGPFVVDDLTQCQDILPTLIELCDLENSDTNCFEGISLVPCLHNETQDFSQRMCVVQHSTSPNLTKWQGTVLWDKWRLVGRDELYNISYDPGQERNIAEKYLDVLEKMRNYYEQWWAQVKPINETKPTIPVGIKHIDPVQITCYDWCELEGEGNVATQAEIRRGMRKNGCWYLEVKEPGSYKIILRRWPEQINVPIRKGVPAHQAFDDMSWVEDRQFWYYSPIEGVALPIVRARIKIDEFDLSSDVSENDTKISFTVPLEKGITKLKTWFFDKEGESICGAYYVYLQRISE